MRAAVMHQAGDVRVETVPDPRIVSPTDAIVRSVRACICGSDLHPYRSLPASDPGRPMGHELIGVVEELGAEVTALSVGDLVVVPFAYSDNTCPACRDGFQAACHHGGFYGSNGVGGLQAELARIPQAAGTLVAVPGVDPATADDTLLKSLLTLSDVYLTGYHAAFMGGVTAGSTVAVVGDGAVGLSAVLAARRMGAEQIILMGRHAERTDLGVAWGATDVVPERGDEGVARVLELTGGLGAQVVLEAVGLMPAYVQSYSIARTGGTISRVGVPQYSDAPVGGTSLFRRNLTLTGGVAPVRAYLEDAIQDVLNGEIDPGKVFDRTIGIEDTPAGYAAMDAREALKVMIEF
ncbi:alcohol dehydrogenase catalytic domain-containing protein [Demequina capsici]|uniref:Alcohol dehydrogenase catalytic domain-containing protein n=1 Tax=Demequina capsici TaxID=3075620 RepID=A0AA96F7N9_9MICO|nr:alcohol dehydrogenase catalytic domain-containing protein [Demequina sp. OYTSA14]WNM25596.1 alcohol dehydrogenase catalytic domain-containing protein [Demequina sp. OYTSA14]